ncbi:MAG: CRISPR-associated endonuclease Cas2, partial [Calditrichaeota bacterium]|nr:CRISPR-associated endonuclease Cas2 [Calditrichota bacterium]
MFIVVSYDIESNRTRTRLAKRLKDFGPRVQKSVFEADIDDGEYERLCKLLGQVRLGDADSIRLYRLCAGC